MDILLIQPRPTSAKRILEDQIAYNPPMMLLYLAKPLLEKGFNVGVLDLIAYNINSNRFKEYIKTYSPSIVGITCMTESFSNAIRAVEYVKSVNPQTKVVVGGPHVTFQSKETLENDCIDVVVRGEGDINFTQLAEHFTLQKHSLAEIKGISYRKDGMIVENPGTLIKDIESLSYPPRNLVNLSRYKFSGIIHSSRGCPFKCHFCSATAMAGGKYRMRSVESVMEEVDYLVTKLGINLLAFSDDTVTGFPKRMKQICYQIIKRDYPVRWICASRVDVVDRDLLTLMARSGCQSIFFGFESGSEAILKSMNKKITPKQIENAVKLCLEYGILPWGNFIIGFPDDTRETIKETCELAKKIKRLGTSCTISILTPFPGSYIYNHADELGITIHSNDWDMLNNPIISTRNLSLDELRTIFFDIQMELYNY